MGKFILIMDEDVSDYMSFDIDMRCLLEFMRDFERRNWK